VVGGRNRGIFLRESVSLYREIHLNLPLPKEGIERKKKVGKNI